MATDAVPPDRRRARLLGAGAALLVAVALIGVWWPESYSLRPVGGAAPPTARAVMGCWQFGEGAAFFWWEVPRGAVVQFDTVPVSLWSGAKPDAYRLRILSPAATASREADSGWGLDSTDDRLLHAWVGDGFTGLDFRLRVHDSLVIGTARGFTDDGPGFTIRHAVHAMRVACPRADSARGSSSKPRANAEPSNAGTGSGPVRVSGARGCADDARKGWGRAGGRPRRERSRGVCARARFSRTRGRFGRDRRYYRRGADVSVTPADV